VLKRGLARSPRSSVATASALKPASSASASRDSPAARRSCRRSTPKGRSSLAAVFTCLASGRPIVRSPRPTGHGQIRTKLGQGWTTRCQSIVGRLWVAPARGAFETANGAAHTMPRPGSGASQIRSVADVDRWLLESGTDKGTCGGATAARVAGQINRCDSRATQRGSEDGARADCRRNRPDMVTWVRRDTSRACLGDRRPRGVRVPGRRISGVHGAEWVHAAVCPGGRRRGWR
jgi:hypothetical protein